MSCALLEQCDPGSWTIILEFLLSSCIFRLKNTSNKIRNKIHHKNIHWPSTWKVIQEFEFIKSQYFLYNAKKDLIVLLDRKDSKWTYWELFTAKDSCKNLKSYVTYDNPKHIFQNDILVFHDQFRLMEILYSQSHNFAERPLKSIKCFTLNKEQKPLRLPKISVNPDVDPVVEVCFASFQNQMYTFFYNDFRIFIVLMMSLSICFKRKEFLFHSLLVPIVLSYPRWNMC